MNLSQGFHHARDLGERTASRIEKFINPAVRDNLSNRDLTELLLVEGEDGFHASLNRRLSQGLSPGLGQRLAVMSKYALA